MFGCMTRRNFVFGSAAAAAVAAGLSGLAGCKASGGAKKGSPQDVHAEDAQYFKSDYDYTQEGEQKLSDDQHALYRQLVEEGCVLLKNENSALPLVKSDGKIMVFGNAGPAYIPKFDEAWKEAGFDFDDACWQFYTDGTQNVVNVAVNENPWSSVEAAGFMGAASGVAIVVLGRRGREGSDNSHVEGRDYLAISAEEREMLDQVAALRRSGTFTKMVVLFNMTNTISWDSAPWDDAIDAVMWCGSYMDPYFSKHERSYSVDPLVGVLTGAANPSGRMPDTIYRNNHANPVMINFGAIDADRSHLSAGKDDEVQHEIDAWKPDVDKDKGSHWRRNYVYAEDIYIGYRYYETRYEDKVLNQGQAGDFDYAGYVAYPFGFGLSYTTFAYSDLAVQETDDGFDVSVKVTNEGKTSGKNAVTVYVQSPYTAYDQDNGVEKAALKLAGYEKSDTIEPGASATVTVHVPIEELLSYDANAAKTYILDDGEYWFSVGNGSHEAMNNILAAKGKGPEHGMTAEGNPDLAALWSNPSFEDKAYSQAPTGAEITNLFDDVDPNKNESMSKLNKVTWMSRSDWMGTYPKEATHLIYTDEVADLAKPVAYKAGSGDAAKVKTHEFGKTGHETMLVDMRGKDYDDAGWEDLISKLSYEEMVSLIADDQTELDIIGKPATKDKDGSNGRAEVFAVSGIQGIPYGASAWRAATFNKGLNYQVGRMIGENMLHGSDAASMKVGLYGFSCNAHRSPYSGRNYEYYSEDPFLSGCAVSNEVKGLVDKGGVTFMKHFAGNDQETYRHGVPSWANEQTLREIYLKPFAMAMTEGGANGLMTGFNRLGMHWTGASAALLKGFAEGEEGYRGLTLTDAYETDYMDTIDGILNGTHAWLNGTGYKNTDGVLLQDDYRSDPVIQDAVFNTVHRILYVMANSLAMNGMTHDTALGATDQKSAMISGEDIPDKTVASLPATMMTSFYEDKTFSLNVMMSFLGSAFSDTGTWDYSDDGGLEMKYSDGTDIEVSEKDGVFFWSKDVVSDLLGPRTATGALSRYELTTAANKAMGTKFAVPDKPLYTVSFSNDNANVSGAAPQSIEVGPGEHFTMPDCPWSGRFQTFDGWNIDGKVYQPGDDVQLLGYADMAAKATWSDQVLVTATTQDTYKYSFIQKPTVPLILRCNGTLRLDALNLVSCTGTWTVAGAGAEATLALLNEAGEPVAARIDNGAITYVQDGFYYDWGQPDVGYGSGVFYTTYTHRIPVEDFLDAYNSTFGTSYTSLAVKAGTASFAEQSDPAAPSLASAW